MNHSTNDGTSAFAEPHGSPALCAKCVQVTKGHDGVIQAACTRRKLIYIDDRSRVEQASALGSTVRTTIVSVAEEAVAWVSRRNFYVFLCDGCLRALRLKKLWRKWGAWPVVGVIFSLPSALGIRYVLKNGNNLSENESIVITLVASAPLIFYLMFAYFKYFDNSRTTNHEIELAISVAGDRIRGLFANLTMDVIKHRDNATLHLGQTEERLPAEVGLGPVPVSPPSSSTIAWEGHTVTERERPYIESELEPTVECRAERLSGLWKKQFNAHRQYFGPLLPSVPEFRKAPKATGATGFGFVQHITPLIAIVTRQMPGG